MTRYNGNVVAYGSGGQWNVYVDVTDDGANTGGTTNVHYTYGLHFNTSISDSSNSVSWTDSWGSGSANNHTFSGSSAADYVVGGATNAATIQYGGGTSVSFHLTATGLASGGTGPSTVDVSYPLPARTPSAPGAPGTPGGSSPTSTSATVSWGASGTNGTAVTSYRLQVATDAGFTSLVYNSDVSSTSTVVSGLTRNTTYYARVYANSAASNSGWSGTGNFTTSSTVPDGMAAPTPSNIQPDGATFTFTAPNNGGSPITGYTLQVSADSTFVSGVTQYTPSSSPAVVSGLTPGTTYFARMKASNVNGISGSWSPSASFSTLSGADTRVAGVWHHAKGFTRVSGTWRQLKSWKNVGGTWRL